MIITMTITTVKKTDKDYKDDDDDDNHDDDMMMI